MARKTDVAQERYDNLLLDTVRGIDAKANDLTREVIKQSVELKANTDQTKQLTTEVKETNGNVRELQSKVTRVEGKVVDIQKVVFPETPVKTPSDLPPSWIKDPQIQSLLKPLLWIILGLVAAYLGAKNIPIPGVG